MMKFFALVALAMFATANASSVTAASVTRATTLLGGAAGGDVVIKFTASNAGAVALNTGTVALTQSATVANHVFAADTSGSVAVTCSSSTAAVVAASGTQATFQTIAVTGTATTQVLTLTMGTGANDKYDNDDVVTITCTGNLANNPAAATTLTFGGLVTSGDTDAATGGVSGYITTTGVTAFSATRGTSKVTALAPGTLVFGFTPTTKVELDGIITLTSNVALYDASAQISCSATYADIGSTAVPTFVAATTKADSTGKILTLTLEGAATDILPAAKAATITCLATNMAVNTAAGDVKFTVGTTTDAGPTVEETGYTICAATGCPTSAASSTASVGMLTMLALAGVAMRQ